MFKKRTSARSGCSSDKYLQEKHSYYLLVLLAIVHRVAEISVIISLSTTRRFDLYYVHGKCILFSSVQR